MAALTREALKQLMPARVERVEIPGSVDPAYVRNISGRHREILAIVIGDKEQPAPERYAEWISRAICYAACDEHGNRLYTDNQIAEVDELSAEVRDALFAKLDEINRLTRRSMDGLEKNSEATTSGESGQG